MGNLCKPVTSLNCCNTGGANKEGLVELEKLQHEKDRKEEQFYAMENS